MTRHLLTVTAPAKWLGTNQRDHFHQRAIATRTWREAAAWAAKGQHLPALGMGPVAVCATVHRSDARKFDLDGVTPTIKACIDGLRDAGVLAEDHWGVITELTIRRGEQWADAALVLSITTQEAVA